MVSYRRLAMRVLGHVPVLFGKKKASPPPRVAAQRITALALACAMMTGMALPAFAATYDIDSGSIDIHATESGQLISQWFMNGEQKEYASDSSGYIQDREDNNITITGTSTGNTVTIDADKDQTAHVTLENVEINASSTAQAAVDVTGSGNTNIELNGNNTLTSGYGHAGLEHNKTDDSGTLTIQDEKNDDGSAKGGASDTTGSLTANGGFHSAGIGGSDGHDGQATITGGEITATGGYGAAGIGGGTGDTDAGGGDGDVTISGGTITATGDYGAGIGGGRYGNGTVIITGGDITAKATGDYGAGIGGGYGAKPKPSGTLIGGNGTVTISGGTITEASGGYMAAGIGSGFQGLGTVTIEGDAVIKNAQGGEAGAGIGSGTDGDSEIIIRGDAVIENAESSGNGAGIGSGQGTTSYGALVPSVGNVTIEGNARIENAKSGSGGSGIGGGFIGIGNVIIRGNAQIGNATGGDEGAGIGGGALGTGDVTIEGNVTIENAQGGAGAAGIGGGAEAQPDTEDTRNKVSIKSTEAGSPDITATGGGASDGSLPGAAAIGSGSVADGATEVKSDITIEGKVTIDATAGGSIAKGDAIAIGDTPLQEKKFAGLPVGAVITRKDSDGVDLTQEGDKPTEPEKPEPEKPDPEKPNPNPENPNPEQPSEPSGAVSTSAPAEELTASDAEYLVTVEGLSVTNALGKQITHTCTQNVQGKVLTIRTNSIVATAHLTMDMLRTLKAQGVETIRFCTLLYRPTSVSIDALLNLGVDEADILWTHNGIQARLTVGSTDSSSLLQ